MPENEPTFAAVGVPERVPVAILNDAHAGLLLMLNDSGSPSGSLALGVKL